MFLVIRQIFFKSFLYALDFPGDLEGKVPARNAGDLGSIPGSGRSPGEGNGMLFMPLGIRASLKMLMPVYLSQNHWGDFISESLSDQINHFT